MTGDLVRVGAMVRVRVRVRLAWHTMQAPGKPEVRCTASLSAS